MQNQKRRRRKSHPIRITISIIICLFLFGWAIIAASNHSKNQSESQTISIAKKYAGLKNPGDFFIYNREQTYYTIAGKNATNQKIFVIVSQKEGKVTILKQSKGISKNAALTKIWNQRKPKKVLKIALGVFNKKPVWEVTYLNKQGNLCYELLAYKDGTDIQKISNL